MSHTIGFASFPKGWEGPVVLEFERYTDHSRVVRYRSNLGNRHFDLYVPKFMLSTGAAAEGPPRIRVAIGRSQERFRTMGYFGKAEPSIVGENICTYDLSEAKANSIRYDLKHEGAAVCALCPERGVWRGGASQEDLPSR